MSPRTRFREAYRAARVSDSYEWFYFDSYRGQACVQRGTVEREGTNGLRRRAELLSTNCNFGSKGGQLREYTRRLLLTAKALPNPRLP